MGSKQRQIKEIRMMYEKAWSEAFVALPPCKKMMISRFTSEKKETLGRDLNNGGAMPPF